MAYIRRYENQAMQNAYENACDCLRYGIGKADWSDCGIPQNARKEVWAVAWYDMGDGHEENGKKPIWDIMGEVYS